MAHRPLLVTPTTMALLLVGGSAWAGPPPPPPSEFENISGGGTGTVRSKSPPPPTNRAPQPTNKAPPLERGGGESSDEPSDPLTIDQRTPDTDLTGNWTYSRGGIVGPNYVRSADDELFYTVNPIGYYQGVSITGANVPPFAPKEVGGETAVLTWTGFERTEASSRVFIQLSSEVQPEIVSEGLRVTVKLPSTSVKVRNNRRKLITKYFNTPVTEVEIKRSKKDVVVHLDLRWEAEPQWRFETGVNGYKVLVLEFADLPEQGEGTDFGGSTPPPPPHPEPPSSDDGESDGESPFLPAG